MRHAFKHVRAINYNSFQTNSGTVPPKGKKGHSKRFRGFLRVMPCEQRTAISSEKVTREREGEKSDIKIKFRAIALAFRLLRLIEKISLPRRKRDETLSEKRDRARNFRERKIYPRFTRIKTGLPRRSQKLVSVTFKSHLNIPRLTVAKLKRCYSR